jgi:hypothetical protein
MSHTTTVLTQTPREDSAAYVMRMFEKGFRDFIRLSDDESGREVVQAGDLDPIVWQRPPKTA